MAGKTKGSDLRRISAEELFSKPITEKQRRELERIAKMPDSEIDFSDAPVVIPKPSEIVRNPIKRLVSLRLDADVLAWYRARRKKYQTYLNEVLRREMQNLPRGR